MKILGTMLGPVMAARLAVPLALGLLALGTIGCGAEAPAEPVSTLTAPLDEEAEDDGDIGANRTVRCGDELNTYRSMSESAVGYSQSAAKRICRQKLVNRLNKSTSCDRSRCGGSGSCRPDSYVRSPSYTCERDGDDYRCRCRPQTVVYACTSCSR